MNAAVDDASSEAVLAIGANSTTELSSEACVGQAGWDTNFASHCYECGFRNMANAYRSGRCMADKQGVSLQCGSCIGQLIHCGTNCIHECCFGHCFSRPSCTACQEKNCNQAFFECSGVYPPSPSGAASVDDATTEVPAIAAGEDAVKDILSVIALDQTDET